MEELLVRYLHFIGFIILSATLVGEHLLLSKEMDLKSFKKLAILDAVYGVSALITLSFGLILWLFVGKPSEFYSLNKLFHLKLTLFGLVAILSIFPTVYFLRHRKTKQQVIELPSYIINIVRLEIVLVALIPLLAVLMARGIGFEVFEL